MQYSSNTLNKLKAQRRGNFKIVAGFCIFLVVQLYKYSIAKMIKK